MAMVLSSGAVSGDSYVDDEGVIDPEGAATGRTHRSRGHAVVTN
jgi:hypothetical protein